ncbi:MAG: RNA polymerase sigma factor [Dehalococcoidia bacterium]
MPDTPPSLLIRLRDADDHRGWQRFFEQYWRLIYSFARKCGLPPRDCEDILQEVVTEVFRAMPRFAYDRSKGTFRAYLRTITQRKIADHLRKAARHPVQSLDHHPGGNGHRPLDDPASAGAEEIWERDWRRNLVQVCLDRVRQEVEPKTFQAFQLYVLEEWPAREVASFLKISTSSVYVAKSRVIQRVRDWVEQETGED